MSVEIIGGDGDPIPSRSFEIALRAFDTNLRVVWGARPYLRPCWVIERRVPKKLYYETYLKDKDQEYLNERFVEQVVMNETGGQYGKRAYDMMPEWHPVYFVINAEGWKMDLGAHVIDYLRANYERTLLGIPELSLKHLAIDREKVRRDKERRKAERLDLSAREVMNHKNEIWSEYFGFGGQPKTVLEGTEGLKPTSSVEESKCVN